jgi:hypothetical protein
VGAQEDLTGLYALTQFSALKLIHDRSFDFGQVHRHTSPVEVVSPYDTMTPAPGITEALIAGLTGQLSDSSLERPREVTPINASVTGFSIDLQLM